MSSDSSSSLCMPAETVAEAIREALESEAPDTRYRVGEDAKFLIELSRTKTDREIDEMILPDYGLGAGDR